jgi:hypothetical protein
MKRRIGFVSNSSSSSFIISKDLLTEKQINEILAYNGDDYWTINVNEWYVEGMTGMDNGDLSDYLKDVVKVNMQAVRWYE